MAARKKVPKTTGMKSLQLTEKYGEGFSTANLRNFRQLYLIYADRSAEIRYPSGSELELRGGGTAADIPAIRRPVGDKSFSGFSPQLSWSRYRALMRVERLTVRGNEFDTNVRKTYDSYPRC